MLDDINDFLKYNTFDLSRKIVLWHLEIQRAKSIIVIYCHPFTTNSVFHDRYWYPRICVHDAPWKCSFVLGFLELDKQYWRNLFSWKDLHVWWHWLQFIHLMYRFYTFVLMRRQNQMGKWFYNRQRNFLNSHWRHEI